MNLIFYAKVDNSSLCRSLRLSAAVSGVFTAIDPGCGICCTGDQKYPKPPVDRGTVLIRTAPVTLPGHRRRIAVKCGWHPENQDQKNYNTRRQ